MNEILKYSKVIDNNKSYIGNEIKSNKELFSKFNRNMLNYPASFLEKVKEEDGLIQITFHGDGTVSKTLINVSSELLDEFHSIYQ